MTEYADYLSPVSHFLVVQVPLTHCKLLEVVKCSGLKSVHDCQCMPTQQSSSHIKQFRQFITCATSKFTLDLYLFYHLFNYNDLLMKIYCT